MSSSNSESTRLGAQYYHLQAPDSSVFTERHDGPWFAKGTKNQANEKTLFIGPGSAILLPRPRDTVTFHIPTSTPFCLSFSLSLVQTDYNPLSKKEPHIFIHFFIPTRLGLTPQTEGVMTNV
jgi:hypothetical protein